MKFAIRACALVLLAAASVATSAAPPPPQLRVAPNGVKQLRFSWNPVAGATSYELWFQSSAAAAETRFFELPSSQTSVVNNVAVHLLDWSNSRYWLKACDSSGCTSSPKISPVNQMLGTIGLFSNPAEQGATQFGYGVALSRDGTTLAVAAPFEAASNPDFPKGSVYVYRKSGGVFALEGTIPLDVNSGYKTSGVRLSINRFGNVLAVALPQDSQDAIESSHFGIVKVFRHIGVNGWKHEATIAPFTSFEFSASNWAQFDDAGHTLAIHAPAASGGANIYTYGLEGSWSHTGTAVGHGIDSDQGTDCGGFALSGDGKVVAFGCGGYDPNFKFFETHAAPDWGIRDTFTVSGRFMAAAALDYTGDLLAATVSTSTGDTTSDTRVEVWRRANGAYQIEATLRRGAWDAANIDSGFGLSAMFSDDDKLLIVGDPKDHGQGLGSLAPPLTAGAAATGAAYVWERRTTGWTLRRVVKPGRGGAYATPGFGSALGLGDNGRTLAVGHPSANGNAGAVWLY